MAKPIKETPILFGRDAEAFSKKIADNETKTATREEYERVMNNYSKIKIKSRSSD